MQCTVRTYVIFFKVRELVKVSIITDLILLMWLCWWLSGTASVKAVSTDGSVMPDSAGTAFVTVSNDGSGMLCSASTASVKAISSGKWVVPCSAGTSSVETISSGGSVMPCSVGKASVKAISGISVMLCSVGTASVKAISGISVMLCFLSTLSEKAISTGGSLMPTLIARFMGPMSGPSGADRTQVSPMLAPWTLLSG